MKPLENALPADPDDRIALQALQRAAKRAHFIAYQNGGGVVIRENGKTVLAPPDPEMYGELLAEVKKKRAAVIANYKKENGRA